MTSPQRFVRDTGFRPRKALGQNFLVHPESADRIAAWSGAREGDTVLEIGPGLGALTDALGRAGCTVTAVEKDWRLAEHLRERWPDAAWLTVVEGDARTWDFGLLPPGRVRVVANLPYSVSTPILERLMAHLDRLADICLLLQEEVVDRICARPGISGYGRLSIWVQTLCGVERGPRVTRGSFFPVPDVESRLVRLTPLAEPRVPAGERPAFLELTALLFQHRRKTVRNSLRDARKEGWDPGASLEAAGIDPGRRPETLSIEEIHRLSRRLFS
jgi:16S rRNA (adenine1518-N6/adenine1519-N6)-dimethyltransferase